MPGTIGVLGGIFDPVHNGHLAVGALARDYFNLETLIYIPSGTPPHKISTVSAPSADRLEMLKIALQDDSDAVIWDCEALRPQVSYTIDTLEELSSAYPDRLMFFIVGADNLNEIHTWRRYRDILARVTLCVTGRPGYSMEIPATLASAKIEKFPSPFWGVSSTLVREYIARGFSCKHLLPDRVLEYISNNGLYRTGDHLKPVSAHRMNH